MTVQLLSLISAEEHAALSGLSNLSAEGLNNLSAICAQATPHVEMALGYQLAQGQFTDRFSIASAYRPNGRVNLMLRRGCLSTTVKPVVSYVNAIANTSGTLTEDTDYLVDYERGFVRVDEKAFNTDDEWGYFRGRHVHDLSGVTIKVDFTAGVTGPDDTPQTLKASANHAATHIHSLNRPRRDNENRDMEYQYILFQLDQIVIPYRQQGYIYPVRPL